MGAYVMGVVGVSLCVGILEEILPSSYGSKTYVRLLTGLCLLAVMIAPVGKVLQALPDVFSELEAVDEAEDMGRYHEILKDSLSETVREQLATAVKEDLAEMFGVKADRTDVGVMLKGEETLSVARLVITLRGADIMKNPYEIEEYFEKRLSCECIVVSG